MSKTVLVTGATDGIGLETARQLRQRGFEVILHGRNPERLEEARLALALESPGSTPEALQADLSSMDEVLALATAVKRHHDKLDVLVHNAGVYEASRVVTADGFERTMAINHFAPFLLTQKLLPALQAAAQGRVVTVSSIAHGRAQLNLDDLEFTQGFRGYGAYAASKLANILFTLELARRLQGTRCTANCLHPGVITTKLLQKGFGTSGDTVERGARTTVHLAAAPGLEQVSGRYFDDCTAVEPSATARDAALATRLWQKTGERLARWL